MDTINHIFRFHNDYYLMFVVCVAYIFYFKFRSGRHLEKSYEAVDRDVSRQWLNWWWRMPSKETRREDWQATKSGMVALWEFFEVLLFVLLVYVVIVAGVGAVV